MCWDWRAAREEGEVLVAVEGREMVLLVLVGVVLMVVLVVVRVGGEGLVGLRGVLKGDLKGWERALVDVVLELKVEDEEVPRRRRLGRGVEDIFFFNLPSCGRTECGSIN